MCSIYLIHSIRENGILSESQQKQDFDEKISHKTNSRNSWKIQVQRMLGFYFAWIEVVHLFDVIDSRYIFLVERNLGERYILFANSSLAQSMTLGGLPHFLLARINYMRHWYLEHFEWFWIFFSLSSVIVFVCCFFFVFWRIENRTKIVIYCRNVFN